MMVVVQYCVNVFADNEDEAKKVADHYFDNQGLYDDDTLADSECVEEFDWPEDAGVGEILVATEYGYDYWDDVKEES